MSVDEALYYALWYEPKSERHAVTPRISPPLTVGSRPDVIPYTGCIHAAFTYLQRIDRKVRFDPSITETPQKLLRSAHSVALGPNAYVFVGEVVANDKYQLMVKNGEGGRKPRDEWAMHAIFDCGVPLCFFKTYRPVPDISCLEDDIEDGAYFEGIVRLSFSAFSTKTGLHQSVTGMIEGAQVLEMDPRRDTFGQICDVPFGTRLSFDPDSMTAQETVFVEFDVSEVGPVCYGTIPARSPECPEPDYPGLVRTGHNQSIRIVELKPPEP